MAVTGCCTTVRCTTRKSAMHTCCCLTTVHYADKCYNSTNVYYNSSNVRTIVRKRTIVQTVFHIPNIPSHMAIFRFMAAHNSHNNLPPLLDNECIRLPILPETLQLSCALILSRMLHLRSLRTKCFHLLNIHIVFDQPIAVAGLQGGQTNLRLYTHMRHEHVL